MTLTEAYERLKNARDLNGILPGDAVDVILADYEYRRTRQGTHWDGCWNVHDDCAAALWRDQMRTTIG